MNSLATSNVKDDCVIDEVGRARVEEATENLGT